MEDDKRLIEDYLPIVAISAEASREKSVRKGHISTLHLWWARRPLVACRAAIYGALVPASQFVPNNASDEKKKSLGRANAARFLTSLCQYPGSPSVVAEAQKHILNAHAQRLTHEIEDGRAGKTETPEWIDEFGFKGDRVIAQDVEAGLAPRPRVLDMFAGGGAIPLEALRLGCEAYALDLNPVAHIIELCTLVYPQIYGKPDPNARGMTGPKDRKGETTWGGLAEEVRYWGNWVLERVRAKIGDLYPLVPDPKAGKHSLVEDSQRQLIDTDAQRELAIPEGHLVPLAYLWTRTVTCKNPNCRATVPLVKQTWLCKRPGRYVAMKIIAPRETKQVRFRIVEVQSEQKVGFDPADFSKGGNANCPFCGTVADTAYVKDEGCAGRLGQQMMAVVCTRSGSQGKIYFSADDLPALIPNDEEVRNRIDKLCKDTGLTTPDEPIITDAKNCCWALLYGLTKFSDLFLPRQLLCLLTFSSLLRQRPGETLSLDTDRWNAIASNLACWVDRMSDFNSTMCTLKPGGERGVVHSFTRPAIPLVWDFAEANPLGTDSANAADMLDYLVAAIKAAEASPQPAKVIRGSATAIPLPDSFLDAVITDPPYYDNVPYAAVSDFFYVWLKRSLGDLHAEHFAGRTTPKRQEAVADATRHGGSDEKARMAYERMMAEAFSTANRVLKANGQLVVVYAHKTTLGWSTLVDALRRAGFMVTEAWPLDTEMKSRLRGMDSAALASSIFLVARKRKGTVTGNFEEAVKPELEQIVRERVETLWGMGISGADLVIACVGAGLRAFTRFARVEYANGEEVPAERFLTEVETAVLESILVRLSKEVSKGSPIRDGSHSLAGLDAATRFYVLWRYTYKVADLDAGEAIIFANGTHVELDGQRGVSNGSRALLEKKKSKYHLRDFTERGAREDLGLPDEQNPNGAPSLVDVLQRILWLIENQPRRLNEYLEQAQPDREHLRQVAQALAGPALKGGEAEARLINTTSAEASALGKLLANWRNLIDVRLEEFRLKQ